MTENMNIGNYFLNEKIVPPSIWFLSQLQAQDHSGSEPWLVNLE